MASENPEAQEAAFKETPKQEGGETSNMPEQEKEATAKQGFSNLPAVLLCDHARDQFHLILAGGRIQTMYIKPIYSNNEEDCIIIGSVEGGWLILYRTFKNQSVVVSGYEDQFLHCNKISLLNPLSAVELDLPPEPCFVSRQDCKIELVAVAVADVVTSNCSPDSPDFIVVAFFLNSNRHWLAFCGIDDESWTRIADIKHIHDASILIQLALALDDENKLLYFLNRTPSAPNYDIMVFDFKDPKNIKMKKLVMAESDSLPRKGFFTPEEKITGERFHINLNFGDRRVYLVADPSRGDLFMVLQKNDVDGSTNILPVKSYRVFMKVEEGSGPGWKEIHDLGDRSIFISRSSASRVISIAEMNVSKSEEEGLFTGNRIYFALQNDHQYRTELRRDVGVFSLADRSIVHFDLPAKFHQLALGTVWWFNPDST